MSAPVVFSVCVIVMICTCYCAKDGNWISSFEKLYTEEKKKQSQKISLYMDRAVVRPRNLCNLINLYSSSNTDIYYINWNVCLYFLGILRT